MNILTRWFGRKKEETVKEKLTFFDYLRRNEVALGIDQRSADESRITYGIRGEGLFFDVWRDPEDPTHTYVTISLSNLDKRTVFTDRIIGPYSADHGVRPDVTVT